MIHSIVLKLLFSSRLETHSVSGSTFWPCRKGSIVYHHQMPHQAFLSVFLTSGAIDDHCVNPLDHSGLQSGNVLILSFFPHLLTSENEGHSVMSDCLRPHGLYSPWHSLGQNTGVGSRCSLLQGIFPTRLLPNSHQLVVYPEVALVVKNLPVNAGDVRDRGLIPGSGRSSGKGNGNPLSIFAWRILWTEEPGRIQPIGSHRVGHD